MLGCLSGVTFQSGDAHANLKWKLIIASPMTALMKLPHTKLQAAPDMFLICHPLEKERKEVIDARRSLLSDGIAKACLSF
jgi:hypothetical protein